MTCKDCIHYEACDRLAVGYNIMQIKTCVCKCFSDKSEWLHLIGKDYKTAYYPVGYGNDAQVIEEPICGWGIKNGKLYVIDECSDFYELGVMVFLTREEAQKDVERRKKIND